MEKFRKSDQFYIDQYDRHTIEELKELELQIEKVYRIINTKKNSEHDSDYFKLQMQYQDTAVHFARQREKLIQSRIYEDEKKDRLIQSVPIPKNVRCNTCLEQMKFDMFDFVENDSEIIFVFSCNHKHLPKKAVYADGREFYVAKHLCSYCGGKLNSTKKETNGKLTLIDTCEQCNQVETIEINRSVKKILPINEDERKRYCTDFIRANTFYEDLETITNLSISLDQDSEIAVSKLKQLNIAQVEKVLSKELEKSQFTKVQFEKPQVGRYLTVEFSAQDLSDRNEVNSVKKLVQIIQKALFLTNWRLNINSVSYKLGFLSAHIKGYSEKDDLLRILKERKVIK